MKTFKIFYHNGEEKRILKVHAKDSQAAYKRFRDLYGSNVKFLGLTEVKNKQRRHDICMIILFATIILIVSFLIGMLFGKFMWNDPTPIDYDIYIVESGDTLWNIATMSNGFNKYDIRFIIDDIQDASNCTAMIYPGQTLYIPIYDD